jgi:TolB-like protein
MSRPSRLAATLPSLTLGAALTLTLAAPVSRAAAQADTRPVVAVLYFDNRAFGKAAADYESFAKGIADLLINDLASAGRVRVVERDRIQAILAEQGLTKAGSVDAATAVKVGKLVGAQYAIMGSFITTPRNELVLTSRSVDVETSVITNPQTVRATGDDVLALISELSGRLQQDLKLPAKQLGSADAGSSGADARQAGTEKREKGEKQVTRGEAGSSKKQPKMDVRTSLLYAKALDEQDRGNDQRATELYRAVLTRVPDYEPAKAKLAKLEKARS